MANTLKFGNENWATQKDSILAYNDENANFKPLPFVTSRASTATRVNKLGLIETVASGIPRVDYLGNTKGALLLEPQSTNLLQYSEDFSQSIWGKDASVTISSDYVISPDGTLNADRFVKPSTAGLEGITQNQFGLSAGTYTFSIYLKSNTSENQIAYLLYANLQSKEVTVTNEWQRFEVSFSAITTVDYIGIVETFGESSLDISLYGAQLEQKSYASSLIPTNGSAVTRLAESATGSGDASTFNDSEGVLFAEISALANDSYRYISLSDGTNSNNVRFNLSPTPNQISFEVNSGGSLQSVYTNNTDVLFNTKLCIKYKQNDFSIYINGSKVHTDSSGLTPIGLDRINFDRGTGGNPFYGKIKQLQYYNTELSNAELVTLTTI